MSGTVQRADVARAHCEDCDWAYERPLDAKDLSDATNRDIARRVIRNHAYKCESTGDEWGQTATVESDIPGGES